MDIWNYDTYIFDLYGTLIDIRTDEHSDETWEKWFTWLDAHNLPHPDIHTFHKDFFDADAAARAEAKLNWGYECPEIDVVPIYDRLFTEYSKGTVFDKRLVYEASKAFRVASRNYMRLFEGVDDFLRLLREKGKKIYILSNAQESYTGQELEEFSLTVKVDGFLISSDCRSMKPDTAFYDMLIEKYNINRSSAVMIGDSRENDYLGGLKAGLNAIWLSGENAADRFYVNAVALLISDKLS